jgi:L-ascorbate metabolism protein UlaG (beta-lactamase superfamily)
VIELRRLAWAGIEMSAHGQKLLIDFVESFPHAPADGLPRAEIPTPPEPGSAALALLTHLHGDHADPPALRRVLRPDGLVLRPSEARGSGVETALVDSSEDALAASGLSIGVLEPWEAVRLGPFTVTAVPAADGFGDPQVSWSVEANGCRILHGGDTVFHGWWWLTAMRLGPFDVAFLPIGGAVVDLPSRQPHSPLPAGMDPRQAAVAGRLLGARQVVPIHYGPIHESPNYLQVKDPPGQLRQAAEQLGVVARVLAPGERLVLEGDALEE